MQKIKLTKKVIIELFVIAGLFLVLLFFAVFAESRNRTEIPAGLILMENLLEMSQIMYP